MDSIPGRGNSLCEGPGAEKTLAHPRNTGGWWGPGESGLEGGRDVAGTGVCRAAWSK